MRCLQEEETDDAGNTRDKDPQIICQAFQMLCLCQLYLLPASIALQPK